MDSISVDCGNGTSITLDVFDSGIQDGPTALITGGMDGDEYAGIQAARELINIFATHPPERGRIVIIPCVNVSGYAEKTSVNPTDGKFPKHIYPGSPTGTSSEQLMFRLWELYLRYTTVWIDLHGGNLSEELIPFVWGWETKNVMVNSLTRELLFATQSPRVVYQTHNHMQKAEQLAKQGCTYVMCESGTAGHAYKDEVRRHVEWSLAILSETGHAAYIPQNDLRNKPSPVVYSLVHEYTAVRSGRIWMPHVSAGDTVKKGQLLGSYTDSGHIHQSDVKARQTGTVLWSKKPGIVQESECVVGLGC